MTAMKIIAHRCNLNGPDKSRENDLAAMRECIALGFDVELDVWGDGKTGELYSGHDNPAHCISWSELASQKDFLWLHCKNLAALQALAARAGDFHFFWHESDDFTLTSKNYIWTYPGKECTANSVIVMPEWNMEIGKLHELLTENCHGVCTDYPVRLKK